MNTYGLILSTNTAVETIFDYHEEELIGCSVNKLMPLSLNKRQGIDFKSYLQAKSLNVMGKIREVQGLRKDGSVVPLDISLVEFSIEGEDYFTGILRDLSLRKLQEQQEKEHLEELAHVTRLCLIGEMGSGIAHEVNQHGQRLPITRRLVYDLSALKILIWNSINALKDMPQNPQRQILIRTRLKNLFQIEIRVNDTGSGIDEAVKEKILAPFLTTKPTCTGMGLSISRSIIEAHEGALSFNSTQEGHYVLFYLTGQEKKYMSNNKPDSLVYLVDDEFAVRDSLALLIESTGQTVRSFESAEAFLDNYDPNQPGCLLLDVRMPSMSGLELQCELLKRAISIPIIFISGHAGIPESAKAFRAGAVDFLEKPFDNQVLLERIEEAINKDNTCREQRREHREIQHRLDHLTLREHEVLFLIVRGRSNKEMARMLDISNRTVEAHRASIMEKMQVKSLGELMVMVTQPDVLNDTLNRD